MKAKITKLFLMMIFSSVALSAVQAQNSSFTYQGRLVSGDADAGGLFDIRFRLFSSATGDSPVSGPVTNLAVVVTNGVFTCSLDFGAVLFNGDPRWLEIAVRPQAGSTFEVLSPRQQIKPTPYAIRAASATELTGTLSPSSIAAGSITGPMLNSSVGSGLINLNASELAMGMVPSAVLGNAWKKSGNTGTGPGDFLGTIDNQPLEVRVNSQRAWRVEYATGEAGTSLNILGGYGGNGVSNTVVGATIAGGGVTNQANRVEGSYGTVGGGKGNTAGTGGTVSGGSSNQALEDGASVSGGEFNQATGVRSAVGGGILNLAEGVGSVVGGGDANVAASNFSTIGGGEVNSASASFSTVAGGTFNNATGVGATVAGGQLNSASGDYSTIPGGFGNMAVSYSLAAGYRAVANHPGSFVWADVSQPPFSTTSSNQFLVRASGGAGIGTSAPAGVLHAKAAASEGATVLERGPVATDIDWTAARLRATHSGDMQDGFGAGLSFELADNGAVVNAAFIGVRRDGGSDNTTALTFQTANGGPPMTKMVLDRAGNLTTTGAINPPSDRNVKQDFEPTDGRSVLERLVNLPVYTWAYKNDVGVRHLGPVAQDFKAAFALGTDDKHISTVDADGVAISAIQGLNQKLELELKRKDAQIEELRQRLMQLEKLVGADQKD